MPLKESELLRRVESGLRTLPQWQGVLFLGSWRWNPYLPPSIEPKDPFDMLEFLFKGLFNLKV